MRNSPDQSHAYTVFFPVIFCHSAPAVAAILRETVCIIYIDVRVYTCVCLYIYGCLSRSRIKQSAIVVHMESRVYIIYIRESSASEAAYRSITLYTYIVLSYAVLLQSYYKG